MMGHEQPACSADIWMGVVDCDVRLCGTCCHGRRQANTETATLSDRVAALEKAEAEKVQVVKAAEADSEAKYLQGQGIARQRQVHPTQLAP